MNKLRTFLLCFVVSTTGILMLCAFAFRPTPEALTPDSLWQILLSAALCSLATAIFFPDENAGKLRAWGGVTLHFISLCAIMVVFGKLFGWVDPGVKGVAIMILYVVLIYAFVTGVSYLLVKKQTDTMNKKLKEKYPDPEE